MVIAKIKVDGVTAVATELSQIPKGIQGATIEVTYDGAWESLNKTAVFSGSVVKDVVNAGAVIPVPPETVAKSGHRLRVGFYGVDGENKVIIPTLWVDLGAIQSAADPSGDASTNPSLPVWAQLQAEVEALKETGGIKGEKGDPGYTPVKGVDYFDGEKGEPGYTPQKGIDYFDGQNGKDGSNGVSCTHTWNGTTLTVTSASGTSSANLKGEKGDKGDPGESIKGDKGDTGDPGADGKSAYQYAQEGGFTGTEAEFMEKLATAYLALVGGTLTGTLYGNSGIVLNATVQGTNNDQGLTLLNSGLSARMSIGNSGGFGIYGDSNVFIRPFYKDGTGYGIKMTKTDMSPTTNNILSLGSSSSMQYNNIFGKTLYQNGKQVANKEDVPSTTETWTFTLEDGSTVEKAVYVG